MKVDPKLHHYCQNIKEGYLNEIVEMYQFLGFNLTYVPPEKDWAMVRQDKLKFSIQITQVKDPPIKDIDIKSRSHIGFISENPQKIISKIKDWSDKKNLSFRQGRWSDVEMFFDLPDIFIDFVVEVMHLSVVEK